MVIDVPGGLHSLEQMESVIWSIFLRGVPEVTIYSKDTQLSPRFRAGRRR